MTTIFVLTVYLCFYEQNINMSDSIVTKLWTTQFYSISKLNGGLKIFPDFFLDVMIFRISLSFPGFPWFFKFSNFSPDFPGFPWVLKTKRGKGENKKGKEKPPLNFFEDRKKCSAFGKKALIQNVVLRVSCRKILKCFSVGTSALVSRDLLTLKTNDCTLALRHYSLCKMLYLKCLTVL